MPKRWCLDCNVLFDADLTGTRRCPTCEPVAARARRERAAVGRPSTSERGYGWVHQRRAAAVVASAKRFGEPCGICGSPCLPDQVVVAHHPDSDAGSGDPRLVRLVPAHKACNDGFRPGRRQ